MTEEPKRVASLRELPQEIAPPRDLWPEIRAQYQAQPPAETVSPRRPRSLYGWSLAATIAALAIGVWAGRNLFPELTGGSVQGPSAGTELVQAAYVTDPRYRQERAALAKSLESRINALPPESRAKVLASLQTIRQSMQEIEQALGRDPGNALLQELLVSTYQDEMRVLAAVHQASGTDEEI